MKLYLFILVYPGNRKTTAFEVGHNRDAAIRRALAAHPGAIHCEDVSDAALSHVAHLMHEDTVIMPKKASEKPMPEQLNLFNTQQNTI